MVIFVNKSGFVVTFVSRQTTVKCYGSKLGNTTSRPRRHHPPTRGGGERMLPHTRPHATQSWCLGVSAGPPCAALPRRWRCRSVQRSGHGRLGVPVVLSG